MVDILKKVLYAYVENQSEDTMSDNKIFLHANPRNYAAFLSFTV